MTRDEVLARLREQEAALKARGIAHAALFGSLARGENGPDSDIDILIELEPGLRIGVWDYTDITLFIEEMFPGKVDVAERRGLKDFVRPNVEKDAVYAF